MIPEAPYLEGKGRRRRGRLSVVIHPDMDAGGRLVQQAAILLFQQGAVQLLRPGKEGGELHLAKEADLPAPVEAEVDFQRLLPRVDGIGKIGREILRKTGCQGGRDLLALDPDIVRLRHLLPAGREKQEQKQYEVSRLHPSSGTSAS